MKLTVSKTSLLPVLTQCSGVADKRSVMPILGNVLLHANGALQCSATDLYQAVASSVPAKISEAGAIALPARDLLERVKMLDGDISITTKGAAVTLKSGSRAYKMNGIPGEEFPSLPTMGDTGKTLTLSAQTLQKLIAGTWFAASVDEDRTGLNGALLECAASKLRMVATSGHRLSLVEVDAPSGSPNLSVFIPLKHLIELRRLCEASGESTVKLTLDEPNLFASVGEFVFSSKLTGAQFPPYQQVLPTHFTGTTAVIRASLLGAVRAVLVAANEATGAVTMRIGGDTIVVDAEDSAAGESRDELSAIHQGPKLAIGCSGRYLIDALDSIDTESVELCVNDELDPMVIKPIEPTGWDGFALVMPMRTT